MKPVKQWSDDDTAELILFDDGSVYTFDEKGAVTIDRDGKIINAYWRGDDEPFDVRQTIWENATVLQLERWCGRTLPLPDSWQEPSYDAIHYVSGTNQAMDAAAKLIALVQAEIETMGQAEADQADQADPCLNCGATKLELHRKPDCLVTPGTAERNDEGTEQDQI